MRQVFLLACATWVGFAASSFSAETPPLAKNRAGELISPQGQSVDVQEGKLVDRTARYYVWSDAQGWHLRCAARDRTLIKFTGTLELSDGEFGKLRPIGLEAKGKVADKWVVDEARRKLEFEINTSNSFDGFDFTLAKTKTANLACELHVNGKPQPNRIFIGKDNRHPTAAAFSLTME